MNTPKTPMDELDSLGRLQATLDKPPLGIMPEEIWKERRVFDIVNAMLRYNKSGKYFPAVWWWELGKLMKDLNK